jgi:hypothetical protein
LEGFPYGQGFSRCAVILLTAASLWPKAARADTVLYEFTQTGFVDFAGQMFSVTGSFAGTPNAADAIGLANLTTFNATVLPP